MLDCHPPGHFLDKGHPRERKDGGQRARDNRALVNTGKNEKRAQVAQAIRLVLRGMHVCNNMNLISKQKPAAKVGHTAGDELLQAISEHTRSVARR